MRHSAYALRCARDDDFDWLYALHVRSMRSYVEATWGWDEAFQQQMFRSGYHAKSLEVIVCDDEDVGVMRATRSLDEIYLDLIEVDPSRQGRGVGTAVVRDLLREARDSRRAMRLQVLRANAAARRLYERLGFAPFDETPTHFVLRASTP